MTESGAILLAICVVGVFGLLIGSFLNVVVYRVPNGMSIVAPPSACPECSSQIRPYDNVPVVSWLVLRGRCRDCGSTISARYPLVEIGTAIAFALVILWIAMTTDPAGASPLGVALTTLAFLYLAAISIALALIDIDTHKLPNKIVLPSYGVAILLLTGAALAVGAVSSLGTALIGMCALGLLYLVLALAWPGGMGFGDVKLAGLLGLYLGYLGWPQLIVGAFAGFILGGLFGLILLITRRASRTAGIPYGPWMLAGAWVGIVFGGPIAAAYLSLIGLS